MIIKESSTPTYYKIYSLTMANYLVRQGFDIKKVDDSERDSKLKKFLFHDGVDFRNAMSRYKRQGV